MLFQISSQVLSHKASMSHDQELIAFEEFREVYPPCPGLYREAQFQLELEVSQEFKLKF